MKRYICNACGYVYDPDVGDPDSNIAPGTAFEDLPDSWVCPQCGVGKDEFSLKNKTAYFSFPFSFFKKEGKHQTVYGFYSVACEKKLDF